VNRYEVILTQLVAADIAADRDPLIAANSHRLRRAAEALEAHFEERTMSHLQDISTRSALLRPQAG
jgi:hypothetical protein